jgi:16S rRNA G966 N2-methylase RsmD
MTLYGGNMIFNEITNQETKMEIIVTNLRRYTFENKKTKSWVEQNTIGKTLNLFAGKTKLNVDEIRNDLDDNALADFHMDALDFVEYCIKNNIKFDTIILDPPYSLRKSMEMYEGRYSSKFKRIADRLDLILNKKGLVISFGYHSTFMGGVRNYYLDKMCVFAHGGSQHCTIAIIEKRNIT